MLATSQKPFGSMTRRNKQATSIDEIQYLKKSDRQMRFNNSKDPIYYIFDCIEDRPIPTLAKEFVRDSVKDVINFVSKVAG